MSEFDIKTCLSELCQLYGPPGQEREVVDYCRPHLQRACDEVWQDEVGNLIGFIKGESPHEGDSVRLFAHMDEIAMMIKRIEKDGLIRIDPLGGIYPNLLGVGPVEILGRRQWQRGVLAVGSVHVSDKASTAYQVQYSMGGRAMKWDHMHVFTGLSRQSLYDKGIRAGTRMVIPRERRSFTDLGEYWGGYFLDNRAAVAAALALVTQCKDQGLRPFSDFYVVLTTEEEVGAHGAKFAARTVPATLTLGLEVGPVEEEYSIDFTACPIMVYRDEQALYDRHVADYFLELAGDLSMHLQTASFSSYRSDVSHAKSIGQSPFSGLICLPTRNTHSYEIIHRDAIANAVRILAEFLRRDCHPLLKRFAPTKSMNPV
jgi:putative aminopeptidase FrvX